MPRARLIIFRVFGATGGSGQSRCAIITHGVWKRKESGKNGCPPAKTGSRFVIAAWIIFCTTAREIRSPTTHPGSERSRQVSSAAIAKREGGREEDVALLLCLLLLLLPRQLSSTACRWIIYPVSHDFSLLE